jgi:glycosyltransferase involved in cell wall biosynthesis
MSPAVSLAPDASPAGTSPTSVLYITYGSLLSPLGQRQVLPYVVGLAKRGFRMAILSFEPRGAQASDAASTDLSARAAAEEIAWLRCTYHPGSSLAVKTADVAAGLLAASRLARRRRIDIVHARSDLPALLGYVLKRSLGCRLLYDVRGLLADEYVDAGHWRASSFTYRLTHAAETWLRARADGLVVLTERVRRHMLARERPAGNQQPATVIPCCVDTAEFHPGPPETELVERLGLANRKVLVYSGSLSTWYMPDEMLRFFASASRITPELVMLVLTHEPAELMLDRANRLGLDRERLIVQHVRPADVPRYLRLAHYGISFIRASFSKQASSPTKIAEYLATGLPLCVNSGVGEIDDLVDGRQVGVLVRAFNESEYQRRWEQLLAADSPELRARCREVARSELDVSEGVRRYAAAYRRLMCSG